MAPDAKVVSGGDEAHDDAGVDGVGLGDFTKIEAIFLFLPDAFAGCQIGQFLLVTSFLRDKMIQRRKFVIIFRAFLNQISFI